MKKSDYDTIRAYEIDGDNILYGILLDLAPEQFYQILCSIKDEIIPCKMVKLSYYGTHLGTAFALKTT